jgi:glucose-1-phosphate adenylyltransferase
MHNDETGRITRFVEKPKTDEVLDSLRITDRHTEGQEAVTDQYLASMGIYVFKRETLIELLENDQADFGKHIIPSAIESHRVYSHTYKGYWEDIGTIRSFYEANLDMVSTIPKFNFFQMEMPIYTRPRFMPASKINGAAIDQAIISDGCIIDRSRISQSLIGIRCLLAPGCRVHKSVLMGADFYETEDSKKQSEIDGIPLIGVGENTRVESAIIDKNARIGANCVISPEGKPDHYDGDNYYVREGIAVVPKGAVIPDDTII